MGRAGPGPGTGPARTTGTCAQEMPEFRVFAKEGVDPTTAKPFTSIEKMLERYLSRRSAASGEAASQAPAMGLGSGLTPRVP